MVINMLSRIELLLESPLHLMLTGIMSFLFIDCEIFSICVGVTQPVLSAKAGVDASEKPRTTENEMSFDAVTYFLNIEASILLINKKVAV